MKSRKLLIGLLVMVAFVVSAGTFAFWANTINGPASVDKTGTVTVGQGKDVNTSFVLTGNTTTGGALVPATQLANSTTGAVSNVTLSYDVQWIEDNTTSQLNGTTSTAPITISSVVVVTDANGNNVSNSVANLIHVTPNVANATSLTLSNPAQTFTFNITMSEPANQAEYNAIVNGTITVTFTYSLGTVTTVDNNQ